MNLFSDFAKLMSLQLSLKFYLGSALSGQLQEEDPNERLSFAGGEPLADTIASLVKSEGF